VGWGYPEWVENDDVGADGKGTPRSAEPKVDGKPHQLT